MPQENMPKLSARITRYNAERLPIIEYNSFIKFNYLLILITFLFMTAHN